MYKILTIAILLTSCATDHTRAEMKARKHLKNFQVSEIKSPVIITVDSRDYIPGRKIGFYDAYHKEILILKNAPDYVLRHEFQHYLLGEIGIPYGLHHSIIND